MTRRGLIARGAGGILAAGTGIAGWSLVWKPALRLRLVHHRVASPAWPRDLPPLAIACVADPHLGPPLRLGMPSEITLVTVGAAAAAAA